VAGSAARCVGPGSFWARLASSGLWSCWGWSLVTQRESARSGSATGSAASDRPRSGRCRQSANPAWPSRTCRRRHRRCSEVRTGRTSWSPFRGRTASPSLLRWRRPPRRQCQNGLEKPAVDSRPGPVLTQSATLNRVASDKGKGSIDEETVRISHGHWRACSVSRLGVGAYGPLVCSGFTSTAPTLDGVLSPGEWATSFPITLGTHTGTAYVMDGGVNPRGVDLVGTS
jgi:hypothetical protein